MGRTLRTGIGGNGPKAWDRTWTTSGRSLLSRSVRKRSDASVGWAMRPQRNSSVATRVEPGVAQPRSDVIRRDLILRPECQCDNRSLLGDEALTVSTCALRTSDGETQIIGARNPQEAQYTSKSIGNRRQYSQRNRVPYGTRINKDATSILETARKDAKNTGCL